jgi:cytochrome c biogenesis protein CcmG, thiol:disulfide interchange protein DsbE
LPGIIRCPGCGQEIDANSRFCVNCTTRICPGCHGPVPPRATFCPFCGFSCGPAVPGASEYQPPAPPPRSFMPSQGGIVGPQPRQFPASQGGIIGPQPGPPPTYYEPQGNVPGSTMPQSMPSPQYGTADQQSGAYGSPGGTPYASMQQPSPIDRRFRDTGPIRVRRFPLALVIILIVAAIGLSGFAVYELGWLNNVQKFVSGINMPGWVPFGNKDTICPTVLNASVSNVTTTSAIVTWKTDEPSTSQVMICESGGGGGGSCTWTELDENLVVEHSVNVVNLKPSTDYHFTATSTDACSNQGTAEGDFTTLGQATTSSFEITGITASNITELAGTISWATDKPATTKVAYGTTNAYGSNTTLDQTLNTSHSVTLSGLTPGTTYHFKVVSQDSSGNEVASLDQTFTTLSTVSASIEVGPEVGNRAPDFTLPTLDGLQAGLSDFRGKLVMINFFQDVQQSRNELSLVQEVYATWPRDKLEVLAISWKQNKTVTQAIATTKGLTLPILLDETGEVATKYNVTQCPVTIFIDSQGIIRDTMYYPATLKNITQVESVLNSMQ